MIDELYQVFKPLLVVFASIIIPVAGLIIFFGGCAVVIKAYKLFIAAVRNRSWNIKNKAAKKIQSLVDRLGDITGSRIASEIDRLNNAAVEAQKKQCVDYRPAMIGKWYDDVDNAIEIYEEGDIYILHFITCENDGSLQDVKLILRAATMKYTNPEVMTTTGEVNLDMAYSAKNDTIFIADLGTTLRRMGTHIESYFIWRKAMENGEYDKSHVSVLPEDVIVDAFNEPDPVNRNIIE